MMKWLMGLALLGIGVALAFAGGRMVYRSRVSPDWPTAQGTVMSSHVETLRGKRAVSFRPEVSYRYEVNGVPYTSDTVAFDGHGSGGLESAQAVSRHYATGSKVTLHYEPDDPSVACLQCGATGVVNYVVTLGGALFAVAAAWGLAEMARAALRESRSTAPRMRAKAP
jgi:hypothetical protein